MIAGEGPYCFIKNMVIYNGDICPEDNKIKVAIFADLVVVNILDSDDEA